MTTLEGARTALQARDPFTRSSTGHAALALGAARRTLLIGTWSTWLGAQPTAARMLTFDFAWFIAETTVMPIVAGLVATVRAIQEVATALLMTGAMISLDDEADNPLFAAVARLLADMATSQCITTLCWAFVPVAVHVLTALYSDFMATSRNRTRNDFMTNDLVLLIVEPARKRCLNVTTGKLDSDIIDDCHTFRWANLAAFGRTCM